jgi:hypothetical protein
VNDASHDHVQHVKAPLDTLPIAQALTAIWDIVPELEPSEDQEDPLVPILQRLCADIREAGQVRWRAVRLVRRCGLGPLADAMVRVITWTDHDD